jgi:hypothetical protein
MKSRLFVCAVLALAAGAAHAADSGTATGARKALARELVNACGQREQITEYFDQIAKSQVATARERASNIPEDQWSTFESHLRTELQGRVDDYLDFVVNIDATHFSEDELKAMAAFCRTPVGRRISAARARIEAETFTIRQQWLETTVTGALQRAAEKMRPEDRGL